MTASLVRVGRLFAVGGEDGRAGELGRLGSDGTLLGDPSTFGSPDISRFGVRCSLPLCNEGSSDRSPAGGEPRGLSLAVFLPGL